MELAGSSSPLSVCSIPPVIMVEPLAAPVPDAVQLLATTLAVKTSPNALVRLETLAELNTDPPAGVPWLLTSSWPEVRNRAGPNCTLADGRVAVTGAPEPPGEGSVTVGAGPEVMGAPLKRLTLAE